MPNWNVPTGIYRGGLKIHKSVDLDESEEEVLASPAEVWGWMITNTATATRFIKFYNAAAADVTVGTTVPVFTWGIPGNASDDVAAHITLSVPIEFDTALSIAATTAAADNDTGAPGACDVIIDLLYKKLV